MWQKSGCAIRKMIMSDERQLNGICLLKLQISPVQEFIAQARSTRDLWSGSYLLSWLMAAGLRELENEGATIIYPAWHEQPLRRLFKGETEPFEKLVIPNLPNVLLARVEANSSKLATNTANSVRNEWLNIAQAVWGFCEQHGGVLPDKKRFDSQVDHFLTIAWQITPGMQELSADWGKWTRTNARQLAAVRQTHAFNAWNSGGWHAARANNKDSLNGRDEAVVQGHQLRDRLPAEFQPLFKNDDWMGAITLIKRLWHVAYLPRRGFKREHFKMPSTLDIAAHDPFVSQSINGEDDTKAAGDLAGGYFAVLAFDGDKMGERIHHLRSAAEHTEFSRKLTTFALEKVRPIIERHDGRVIYAGGDDVLALLPADMAMNCAEELQTEFFATTGCRASAGIAIAKYKNPLQDVVRAAQAAEKRAKQKLGRSAVAITLVKGSGETIEWGCQLGDSGLELFKAIAKALIEDKLSAKFTYALIELLQPYLSASTPLMETCTSIKPVAGFLAAEVIRREFDYVLSRQHGPQFPKQKEDQELFRQELGAALDKYLAALKPHSTERQLKDVMDLCRVVAFAPAQAQIKNNETPGNS
jgi:CRISPR-associated protein Cmr2